MEFPCRPPPRVGDGVSATITDPGGVDFVDYSPHHSLEPIHYPSFNEVASYSTQDSIRERVNESTIISPVSSVDGRSTQLPVTSPRTSITPQPNPEETVEEVSVSGSNAGSAQWNFHLLSPLLMVLFFASGIAFAFGHHAYYQSFDGAQIDSESSQLVISAGVAFAVLVKTALSAAVAIAFAQQLWVTVRKRFLSLRTIDCCFSMLVNPIALANSELLIYAKRIFLLGLIIW